MQKSHNYMHTGERIIYGFKNLYSFKCYLEDSWKNTKMKFNFIMIYISCNSHSRTIINWHKQGKISRIKKLLAPSLNFSPHTKLKVGKCAPFNGLGIYPPPPPAASDGFRLQRSRTIVDKEGKGGTSTSKMQLINYLL